MRASVGHVRDLPKSNKKAIDIPGGFIPSYEISKGKEKVITELQALGEDAKEILLATDPDREGEAISWHLEQLLKENKKIKVPIKRVAFNEITKEAVTEALKHPRDIDSNLVKAQKHDAYWIDWSVTTSLDLSGKSQVRTFCWARYNPLHSVSLSSVNVKSRHLSQKHTGISQEYF